MAKALYQTRWRVWADTVVYGTYTVTFTYVNIHGQVGEKKKTWVRILAGVAVEIHGNGTCYLLNGGKGVPLVPAL